MTPRLLTLAVVAALVGATGCIANPTPHPEKGADTINTPLDDSSSGALTSTEVCAEVGGYWNEGESRCDLSVETSFDADYTGGSPEPGAMEDFPAAHVIGVTVAGEAGAFTFEVTIESDDTGCDRYADWWEVVGFDGELLYRRILTHPHTGEQPFTRAGEPVDLQADTPVVVRGHLSSGGYTTQAMVGTAAAGFVDAQLPWGFAGALETAPPQPGACGP